MPIPPLRPLCIPLLLLLSLGGCDDAPSLDGGTTDGGVLTDGALPDVDGAAPSTDGGARDGGSRDAGPPPPSSGRIPLRVEADRGAVSEVLSVAVPFPAGALSNPDRIRVLDASGDERASNSAALARWPIDDSVRSVLVVFRADLASGGGEDLEIEYGATRSADLAEDAVSRPDAQAVATLDTAWLAASRVAGPLVPAADNTRFADFERIVADELANMDPAFDSYGVSCGSTSRHRTYYDSPHTLWMHYLRDATAANYRRAREESNWYRDNELEWHRGRELAVQVCEDDGWSPTDKIGWSVIRRMTGGGMLDDYLVTGDPAAREAVMAMGEAFVQSLPAQRGGRENSLRVTERNLAWTLMGVAAYYAIQPTPAVRAALDSLVEEAVDWQAASTSGAFEHDIVRPDPDECSDGPAGASPFMTSLLIDGLMDAYALTGDARIPGVVQRSAAWFRDSAVTSAGDAFRYLWGCNDNGYDDTSAELNNLIVHVFGAAFEVSGDTAWLDAGDAFADAGLSEIYAGRPKQWTQTVRGFARYVGYRAGGRTP